MVAEAAPGINRNVTLQEELDLEHFEDKSNIWNRLQKGAKRSASNTASAVVDGIKHGTSDAIDTVRFLGFQGVAPFVPILFIGIATAVVVIRDLPGREIPTPTLTPTFAPIYAETSSSAPAATPTSGVVPTHTPIPTRLSASTYTHSYTPPSLIASPTPSR